jgi:mono/diheme cytochrome c family protein
MTQNRILLWALALSAGFVASAIAQEHAKPEKAPSASAAASATTTGSAPSHDSASAATTSNAPTDERIGRLEGEKRFRTNCGRCHVAPHKFPPRVMATAIRHMRIRAMITDEDMRLILRYMTE